MYKVFRDDDGKFYTLPELRGLYDEIREELDGETFGEWLNNATSKNGSLSGVSIEDGRAEDLAHWLSCHSAKTRREIFDGLTSGNDLFAEWLFSIEDDDASDAAMYSKIYDVFDFCEAKAHYLKSM